MASTRSTPVATPPAGRAPAPERSRLGKSAERRDQLTDSALTTLGELGYARTSLREIAANSEFSHGVVHYYFNDKTDLILASVRRYKASCVTRYDDVVATARTPEQLVQGFADKLVETILDEAPMHRLWYDLRTQSMFEAELQQTVTEIDDSLEEMIARILTRYAELSHTRLTVPVAAAYAMFDGVFERALLRHLAGFDEALTDLRDTAIGLLPRLFA